MVGYGYDYYDDDYDDDDYRYRRNPDELDDPDSMLNRALDSQGDFEISFNIDFDTGEVQTLIEGVKGAGCHSIMDFVTDGLGREKAAHETEEADEGEDIDEELEYEYEYEEEMLPTPEVTGGYVPGVPVSPEDLPEGYDEEEDFASEEEWG